MGLLSKLFSNSHDIGKDINDSVKIRTSQAQFNSIAHDTIELTKSVTQSLKDKITDYARQIDSLSHMMTDALLIADDTSIISSANTAAQVLFDEPVLTGKSITTLLNIKGCHGFEDFIHASINTSPDIYEDFSIQTKSGLVYLDVSVAMVKKSDNTSYYLLVLRNVTERIMDMKRLSDSEQRFRKFSESAIEALVIHNGLEILDCNEQFLKLSGYSREEVIGSLPDNFVFPTDRDKIMSLERSSHEGTREFCLINKAGDPIVVSMASNVIQWDDNEARINIIHDITIYKDEEKILKSSRERYRNILDNNIDILCCYKKDFSIDFVNHTFEEYFNIPRKDILGKSILDFVPLIDHDLFVSNLTSISLSNPVTRSLYRLTLPDGSVRWQDWIDRGIFDADGNLLEYQSVSRDVTHYINVKISGVQSAH